MGQYLISRVSHRKPLKNKKLGFFAERHLIALGIKDADKGIVKKDLNGHYTSPYIEKEINLCIVQIRAEQEQLEKILLPLQTKIFNHKQCIAKQNTILECIDLHNNNENTDIYIGCTISDTTDEIPSNNFSNLLEKIQNSTRLASIQQQTGELKASVEIIQIENEEIAAYIEKEKKITMLRCLQAYNFLIARLSAYWKGVLLKTQSDSDFMPLFEKEILFKDIEQIIDEII